MGKLCILFLSFVQLKVNLVSIDVSLMEITDMANSLNKKLVNNMSII